MRTTHPQDDDAKRKLKAESRRAGRSFRDVANEKLRRGLTSQRAIGQQRSFQVEVRDLGDLKPGLSLDNVGELIKQVEGPTFH